MKYIVLQLFIILTKKKMYVSHIRINKLIN